MAEVIATDIRLGVDPACLGQIAVNLERTLSEMVHGMPAATDNGRTGMAQFEKGQLGNPAGRPKGSRTSSARTS
jgi:hypothetical protein